MSESKNYCPEPEENYRLLEDEERIAEGDKYWYSPFYSWTPLTGSFYFGKTVKQCKEILAPWTDGPLYFSKIKQPEPIVIGTLLDTLRESQ